MVPAARIIQSFLTNSWVSGTQQDQKLINPVNGELLATSSSQGYQLSEALDYAREIGGPALRELSYQQRAAILSAISGCLAQERDRWLEISRLNSGNTKADAAIDVDGAIATIKYYSKLGEGLGGNRLLADGPTQRLGRDPLFQGQHVGTPLRGVAVHINAYNFPAWGLWEKLSVSLLSGVPVLAKPASSTSWLAEEMVRSVLEAGIVPEGTLSLYCGSPQDLLNHLMAGDCVAFTGSAETGNRIRGSLSGRGVRLNIEADSLNAAILGADEDASGDSFENFANEVAKEMTSKAGQKCTAIRRIVVPQKHLSKIEEAILQRLSSVRTGDPASPDVGMGPVVTAQQRQNVEAGIEELSRSADILTPGRPHLIDADWQVGAFVAPTLLRSHVDGGLVNQLEVFGPVATLIPYETERQAFELVREGNGSLVASVFSADRAFLQRAVVELGSTHGRLLLADPSIGQSHSGHGIVLPACNHGGPGRAGDGAELGGTRGLWFYNQRTAIQASAEMLAGLDKDLANVGS